MLYIINNSLPFVPDYYSIVWIYHSLYLHLSVGDNWGVSGLGLLQVKLLSAFRSLYRCLLGEAGRAFVLPTNTATHIYCLTHVFIVSGRVCITTVECVASCLAKTKIFTLQFPNPWSYINS